MLSAGLILRKIFTFPALLGVALAGGAYVFARFSLLDPDTWWHLAVGKHILETRSLPTVDPYSFTVSGTHWIAYEWLGEVVMALAGRLGGLRAPTVLLVLLSASLLVLLYCYAWLRSGNFKAAFIACALVLPVAAAFFTLRPQLLGYNFLLITLICLEQFRRGHPRALWLLPPLFLVWVNTHGTFVFGLVVVGLAWLSGQVGFDTGGLVAERWTREQSRYLAVVMFLCVLVLPLTPYGTRIAAYPLEMSLAQPINIASINEWQPLAFNLFLGKLFLGLVLLFFLLYLAQRPPLRLAEVGLLLFAVFAACVHLRFLPIFLASFTPLLALLLARWMPGYEAEKERPVLNVAFMALIAASVVFSFPSSGRIENMAAEKYPRDAVAYLRAHPVRGPMLNEYGWGGYLIWAFGREHKVFIDGRADIYEYAGVLSDYIKITHMDPEALLLLRKYGIEACLVTRKAPLATLLAALPNWERIYSDELATLYVHKRRHLAPGAVFGASNAGGATVEANPSAEYENRQSGRAVVHKR
ncbi:MAG: hypothetical protein WAR21_14450 [Candidatus Acidiferrales bacterium]